MLTVTVYTTGPSSERTRMTIDTLAGREVTFVTVDISDRPPVSEFLAEDLGYTVIPVVVVEDRTGQDHWCGYRPDQINRVATMNKTAGYQIPFAAEAL